MYKLLKEAITRCLSENIWEQLANSAVNTAFLLFFDGKKPIHFDLTTTIVQKNQDREGLIKTIFEKTFYK